jgi:hypothetical protein
LFHSIYAPNIVEIGVKTPYPQYFFIVVLLPMCSAFLFHPTSQHVLYWFLYFFEFWCLTPLSAIFPTQWSKEKKTKEQTMIYTEN